jgi:deoxyribose-phosphate aldolase
VRFEIACYDKAATDIDLAQTIFTAAKCKFNGICVPAGLVHRVKDIAYDLDISAAVDFPFGIENVQVRISSTINAARRGANCIDLVVNNHLIGKSDKKALLEDLCAHKIYCQEKNLILRAMFEYRLFEGSAIVDICKLFAKAGLTEIVTCTGTIVDDILDNLIIANQIKKTSGLDVIVSTNIANDKIIDLCRQSKVYGIRFLSYKNIISTGV